MAKPWFAPKRYGYGSVPATWEGWLATAIFVIAFCSAITLLHDWRRWICGGALVVIFIGVARAKTSAELRWRWGKP